MLRAACPLRAWTPAAVRYGRRWCPCYPAVTLTASLVV
jgi:hypothetical protein